MSIKMSSRLGKVTRRGKEKNKRFAVKIETTETGQNTLYGRLTEMPDYTAKVEKLVAIPNIQPFFHADLIPELLSWVDILTEEQWVVVINQSNPDQPESIIFNSPFNEENKLVLKAKQDTDLYAEETIPDSRYPCPRCKCIESYFNSKQTRGGDEGQTITLKCAKCGYTRPIGG
jgi:DNA-directed RNA polymerase subunit M/transcription elongation factor TFIIS